MNGIYAKKLRNILVIGAAAGMLLLMLIVLISARTSATFYVYDNFVGNTEVQLSWQDGGSESFLRYELYRNDQNIHTAHDNASTTYQDFDIIDGIEYEYKVKVWYWDDDEEEEYVGNEGTRTVIAGDVHGTLIFDTGWTAADGPYNLTGDVIAGEGGELTINQGTTIYTNGRQLKGADPHIEKCTIYGGLIFEGVQELRVIDSEFWMDPGNYIQPGVSIYDCHDVLITGNEFHDYNPGAWPHHSPGVRFDLDDSSTACSYIDIIENTFTNCYYGIFGWKLRDARVYTNTFTDSYYGLWIDDELWDSEVSDNTFDRIEWEKSHALGLLVTGFNSTVHENTFIDLGQGIQMRGEDSRCYENTMINCTDGIQVWGTRLEVDLNTLDSGGDQGQGIELTGSILEIHDNTLTEFKHAGIVCDDEMWNSVITKNQISGGGYGIHITWEWNENVTITDNYIHNNTEDGIYLERTSNFKVENNRILHHNWGNGINLHYGCFENTIRGNTIQDLKGSGIYLGGDHAYDSNELNTFEDNTLTDVGTGIELAGEWDVNDRYTPQDNNTFRRNTVTYANHGIMLEGSSNNTFLNNSLHDIGTCGIQVWHYWDYYWEHSAYCYYNTFEGNVITTRNQFGWGIKDEAIGDMGSQHKLVTMGNTYPTTLSIKDFNQTIEVRGVDLPPEMPGPPDFPSKNVNISNFVYIQYDGGPFQLKFHYKDEQLGDLEEANLWLWRMAENETGAMVWDADREAQDWQRVPFLQPGLNEIHADMENNSGKMYFAPLISMPVHNIDTELDYNTIMDAIDNIETLDGHTIMVDPAYTTAWTKENIQIHKTITLASSSGGPTVNILRPEDPELDVIDIMADGVTIRGFTIQGSTAQRGVYCRPDRSDILVENCAFTANFNGIYYTGNEAGTRGEQPANGIHGTREDHGTIIIRNCQFKDNLNADVILNTTIDCIVEDNAFNGGQHGLALQFSEYTKVYDCTFTGYEEMAIYILEGGSHMLVGNEIAKSEVGMRLHTTTENDISYTDVMDTVTGFELIRSDDNLLENNTITGDTGFGVKLDGSDSNIIRGFDISLTGKWLTGVQLEASGDNSLYDLNLHDFNTVGYGATGIRVFAGSSQNVVNNSVIDTIESSNSTALVAGSPLNTFNLIEITSIISYGNGPCYGVHVLPFANSNLFNYLEVLTVTGNEITAGIYLDSNNDNNITNIVVEDVTSNNTSGVGVWFNNCPTGFLLSSDIHGAEIGILCEAASNPELHWNSIMSNSVFGLQNTDALITINAENNFWGHNSGPAWAGPGTGDKVSEYVDFEPWTGTQTVGRHEQTVQPGTGTMDSLAQSDTEVVYDTDSEITITTQGYTGNPGNAFSGDLGKYIDVHLDSSEGVNEIEIRLYYTDADLGDMYETTLRMSWWDGEAWHQCSETGVNTEDTGEYAGYIWVRISSGSTPTLSDMTGTPFCGEGDEEYDPTDDDVDDDDDGIGVGLIIGIVVIIVVVLVIVLMQLGLLPIGDSLSGSGTTSGKGKKEEAELGKDAGSEKGKKED